MSTIYFSDLPLLVAAGLTNGCGPRKPQPGEVLKWWIRILRSIRPPQWHSRESCCQHDIDYLVGADDEARRIADYDLRVRMLKDAAERPWWQQPWYRSQAWLYWGFVRVFGRFFFYYGKQRTVADLINIYQARLRAQQA